MTSIQPSTGFPAFDHVLRGLRLGDNVVWEVASIEDYAVLVGPFVKTAIEQGRKLTYFRFAKHPPLLSSSPDINVVALDPQAGFESFLDGIHRTVERIGRGAYYVFDSLSDLTADWYCDQMLGNFFQLTCPYLYALETIAYFGLMRNFHSSFAMVPISETTQLLLEVFRREGKLYVQPLKVQDRFSRQMNMLYVVGEHTATPVTESHTVSEILTASPRSALGLSQYHLGVWTRTFVKAEALLEEAQHGRAAPEAMDAMFHRVLRMAISRHERVLHLAECYFDLADVVAIVKRLLGTGLIGGKSVGMLLARAILKRSDPKWNDILEAHDSFYIPSDVYYTFLVRNGCWKIRKRQAYTEDFLEGAADARQRILMGTFPPHIEKRFADMLDYFGQSPIIVRSSSLLEDNFGNSFAGKYESVFCANQGSRQERLEHFISAVKSIYASTMSKQALTYRARQGLLDRDEQMALLVQRVSGERHGRCYYPHIAGVAFSFNPYVWNENIDPKAGVLRLVFGLGTRAVDRSDDDYTRLVALNAPERLPEATSDDSGRYTQRKVDVIDLEMNQLVTSDFQEVAEESPEIPLSLFATPNARAVRMARESGGRRGRHGALAPLEIRFDQLLTQTSFVQDMRDMLRTLHEAYQYPVDVEFTANFDSEGHYKMNLVQCRPFQVKGEPLVDAAPGEVRENDLVLRTNGPVIGQSRLTTIDRIIYVVPSVYGALSVNERYSIARLIGRLIHSETPNAPGVTMLLGPGRWGTTTPSLGVPVSFGEINTISVLCEIVAMRDDLVPDVSFGTHFFCELVEMDILYLALFPNQQGSLLNKEFFEQAPNQLCEVLPDATSYEHIVRVIDPRRVRPWARLRLYGDVLKQRVLCYFEGERE